VNQKIKNKFGELERKRIVDNAKRSLMRPEGKKALDYLRKVRCFSDAIIDRFDFGYCPPQINHQLRGRIITPIYDAYKELISLSTRHLDENHSNRFWHESFNKSFYTYGLTYAKYSIMKYKKVIIVEGEFDVAALHTHGITIAVGVCGKALTLSQIVILSRYCSEMYIVFDGDEPGRLGIEKAMELYKKNNLMVYGISFIPVYLPNKLDPDKFIKEEKKEKFISVVKQSKQHYLSLN
jgi:DNA primase